MNKYLKCSSKWPKRTARYFLKWVLATLHRPVHVYYVYSPHSWISKLLNLSSPPLV